MSPPPGPLTDVRGSGAHAGGEARCSANPHSAIRNRQPPPRSLDPRPLRSLDPLLPPLVTLLPCYFVTLLSTNLPQSPPTSTNPFVPPCLRGLACRRHLARRSAATLVAPCRSRLGSARRALVRHLRRVQSPAATLGVPHDRLPQAVVRPRTCVSSQDGHLNASRPAAGGSGRVGQDSPVSAR